MSEPERIGIRRARPADTPDLTALTQQLGYPADPSAISRRLRSLLDLESHALFVANEADQVFGWVHVFMAHRLESDACAEIGGLVVDASRRRRGVGKALVGAAEDWARSRGLMTVRVRSNIIREGAHRFYLRLGYASLKQSTVFARSLETAS